MERARTDRLSPVATLPSALVTPFYSLWAVLSAGLINAILWGRGDDIARFSQIGRPRRHCRALLVTCTTATLRERRRHERGLWIYRQGKCIC
jgi:hypothetical protein